MKMNRRLHRNLLNTKGFMLLEMLISVLIVSLSGTLIIGGLILGVRHYSKISEISEAQLICTNYESRIIETLSQGTYYCDYENQAVFLNRTVGSYGYYTNYVGEIVFKPVKIDYFGNVNETSVRYKIIPSRNTYKYSNGKKYISSIDYNYKKRDDVSAAASRYEVTITVTLNDEKLYEKTFSVFEKGEIIKA